MLPDIKLTQPQRSALHAVFAPFADRIETVGIFGSRVQGTARAGSDVDLVVYGGVSRDDIAEITSRLEESDLSIFADVVAYESVSHKALKLQIDQWMRPLFERVDLKMR